MADSQYRSHCYWVTSTPPGGATDWRVTDAMTKCHCEGGQLAPVIDDVQFAFLTNLLSTISGFETLHKLSKSSFCNSFTKYIIFLIFELHLMDLCCKNIVFVSF